MDAAAVPRSDSERACLPVSHSRPRHDFLGGSRCAGERIRFEDPANTGTSAESERLLRTLSGQNATGVFGLGDSPERKTSAEDSARVGDTLQSGATSRQPRSRDTRADQEASAERAVREAPIARGLPNQNKRRSWRTPS